MKWLLHPQRKNHLAPTQQDNEWYSQTVWTSWRREKSLAPGRIWILDHLTCRLTFYQICYVPVLTCTLTTNVTAMDNDCGTVLGMLLEIPFLIFHFLSLKKLNFLPWQLSLISLKLQILINQIQQSPSWATYSFFVSTEIPHVMEFDCSLQCLQQPATCPHP